MSLIRTLVAVIGGLLGAVIIWTTVPYNNFVLGNSHISDSYLPGMVLVLLSVSVLLLNRQRPAHR